MKRPTLILALAFAILAVIAVAGTFVMMAKPSAEPAGDSAYVQAYFWNDSLDPELTCTKVFPVERAVPAASSPAGAALAELLKGPTKEEYEQGYRTAIKGKGVKVNRLAIENGVARIDFNEAIQKDVGGSCTVLGIRKMIEETLKQFPTVKEVEISVGGDTKAALQP